MPERVGKIAALPGTCGSTESVALEMTAHRDPKLRTTGDEGRDEIKAAPCENPHFVS